MAVINIRERVTEDEQGFVASAFSDRSLLLLQNANPPESFSVELTIGESWSEKYGAANNHMHRIVKDEGVEIHRNSSVVIEVAEEIRVPHNMYGIVVPTGSLFLDRGVIIAAAKVEPSFSGKLKLRLVNTTNRKVILEGSRKVASIIFFSTETTKFHAPVEKSAILDRKPVGWSKRARRWLLANHIQVIGWVVAVLAGAVMAALLNRYVLLPPVQGPPTTRAPR